MIWGTVHQETSPAAISHVLSTVPLTGVGGWLKSVLNEFFLRKIQKKDLTKAGIHLS